MSPKESKPKVVPVSIKMQRIPGDLPVFLFAAASGLFVATLIILFLVVLPNSRICPLLKTRMNLLDSIYDYHKGLADNLPKSKEEMEDIRKESSHLEKTLSETPADLKEVALKAFKKNHYEVESYRIGGTRPGDDQWWESMPVEFTVLGDRKKIKETVSQWRKQLPYTVRLREVDIKKNDDPDKVTGVFSMKANFVVPMDKINFKRMSLFQPMTMPESNFFESHEIRDLKKQIDKKESEIMTLGFKIGDVSHLRDMRARLLALQSRKADYTAQHEREFDLLERQLAPILDRLNEKPVHRIIIKVEDTMVRDGQKLPERTRK